MALTILTIMKIKIGILNWPFLTSLFQLQFFILVVLVLGVGALLLTGCQTEAMVPTVTAVAPIVATEVVELPPEPTQPSVPPTWTPQAPSNVPIADSTQTRVPTSMPRATKTPLPTLLPTLTLTSSPTPVVTEAPMTDTPQPPSDDGNVPPSIPANPILGENLLPNGSFEEGHYNMWGIPELQLPVGWVFEWDESRTGFGSESWDVYVRPETRVFPPAPPTHRR